MKRFFVAISVLVFAVVLVHQTYGLCNTCSGKTGLACVSNNQFKVCQEGIPQGPSITCPGGGLCTPDEQVCDLSPTATKSCGKCKTCNSQKVFACTKYNKFSLCLDGIYSDSAPDYFCPEGLVCSIDSINICVNGNLTGIGGTCPWEEVGSQTTLPPITTTPNPITNPVEFCTNKGSPLSYEVSSDKTCKQFIKCTLNEDSSWSGGIYTCPKDTFFNVTACGTGKPARCTV